MENILELLAACFAGYWWWRAYQQYKVLKAQRELIAAKRKYKEEKLESRALESALEDFRKEHGIE